MAGYNRKDWEDLNITKEEVENITQALKKEEFRKLLAEYAEEITDPKNRKQYQDEIIQLEAERGVDCTFVNPEPGFVIKTSVDGKKKAFINICKNKAVGRPSSKPEMKDMTHGLSWSIPLCQAPGREDFDKKRNRCIVYDVIFHPDTLYLAEKNLKFKKLVIDTALNAVEESYNVNLDKTNIKLPKLKFKGLPIATVIRKKSKQQPVLTEEDQEFFEKIQCPFKPLNEAPPIVRNLENIIPGTNKYTIPKYIIKYRSDIDLQEFTYDKNAKINAAIPKQLVIEINLPLINSTQTVSLDIMEKSLHLLCETPAKYKLDIQFPYSVNEEAGNAKFDLEKRLLTVVLPVVKAKMSLKDLMREDSGVESDLSPVGSISNTDFANLEEDDSNLTSDLKDLVLIEERKNNVQPDSELAATPESNEKPDEFLEKDKHYLLPGHSCNLDGENICFVLHVKNVDSNSLIKKTINSSSCHIKFVSIGSGFFPIHYAFFIDFKDECNIKDVICETWDNNVTVLVEFVKNNEIVTKYYAGLNQDTLSEHFLNFPLELKLIDSLIENKLIEEEENKLQISVDVEAACQDEVVVNITPIKANDSDDPFQSGSEIANENGSCYLSNDTPNTTEEKCRTLSESGVDEMRVPGPLVRKSILKKRIGRSLSESNADDYILNSCNEKSVYNGSDFCIHEEPEVPSIKKTVRFSEKIRQQLFRVNSSILGRKNKNRKKSRNKKRALERKLSESETSETESKDTSTHTEKLKKSKFLKKKELIEDISHTKKEEKENSECNKQIREVKQNEEIQKLGLKKDDKIFEFKSDLIFDLEV